MRFACGPAPTWPPARTLHRGLHPASLLYSSTESCHQQCLRPVIEGDDLLGQPRATSLNADFLLGGTAAAAAAVAQQARLQPGQRRPLGSLDEIDQSDYGYTDEGEGDEEEWEPLYGGPGLAGVGGPAFAGGASLQSALLGGGQLAELGELELDEGLLQQVPIQVGACAEWAALLHGKQSRCSVAVQQAASPTCLVDRACVESGENKLCSPVEPPLIVAPSLTAAVLGRPSCCLYRSFSRRCCRALAAGPLLGCWAPPAMAAVAGPG